MKEELPIDVQNEVFILDSQISKVLDARKSPKEIIPGFTFCDWAVRIVILPYNFGQESLILLVMKIVCSKKLKKANDL